LKFSAGARLDYYSSVKTFKPDGAITAGNSSGIVDGAAAVLIGSKEAVEKAGLQPRVRIRAFANIGSEPAIMLTGPVDVTKKVLARSGMAMSGRSLGSST
jgi:acetyl-CoA acetyltransferase